MLVLGASPNRFGALGNGTWQEGSMFECEHRPQTPGGCGWHMEMRFGILGEGLRVETGGDQSIGLDLAIDTSSRHTHAWQSAMGVYRDMSSRTGPGMIGGESDLDSASGESECIAIVKDRLDIFGFESAHDAVDPASFEDSLLGGWANEHSVHDRRELGGNLGTTDQVGHAVGKAGAWQFAMGTSTGLSSSAELDMIFEELDLYKASDSSERIAIVMERLDIFGFEPAHDAADPASFEDSLLGGWANEHSVHDRRELGGNLGTTDQVGHAVGKAGARQFAMVGEGSDLGMIGEESDLYSASDTSKHSTFAKQELDIFGFVPAHDAVDPASFEDSMWIEVSRYSGDGPTAPTIGHIIRSQAFRAPPEPVNDTNSPGRRQGALEVARGSASAAVAALRSLRDANGTMADSSIPSTLPVGMPSDSPHSNALTDANRTSADQPILPTRPMGQPNGPPRPNALTDANSTKAEHPMLPTPPVGKPSGRPAPKSLRK
mmetsp:Transcript_2803/g.8354  ORF Transcript_2803/g.8354 Transcript_2803/m.8354 type:complete len:490 (+) Transcript_2803:123-1592(+)